MTRITDTRARVREVAERLAAANEAVTYSRVLRELGKGSPNTVVDELAKWRANKEQQAEAIGRVDTEAREVLPLLTPETVASLLTSLQSFEIALPEVLQALHLAAGHVQALATAVASQKEHFESALEVVSARFDSVQRRCLLMVDEARESSRYWNAEAVRLRSSSRDQEEHYRRAMYAAQERAAHLEGKLEALSTLRPPHPRTVDVDRFSAGSAGRDSEVAPSPVDRALSQRTSGSYYDPDGSKE